MQNDKNTNEKSMTLNELQREIEKQKAIIAAKERGASEEEIEKIEEEYQRRAKANSENSSEISDEPKKATVLQKIGRIAYIILNVVLVLIVLGSSYALVAKFVFKVENPTVFGLGSFSVTTWSMEGNEPDSIKKGSLVFTVKKKKYEINDVVTFLTDKDKANAVTTPTTHRIIEITDDGFYRTKGDNPLNSPDEVPISEENIIGKVYLALPGVGDFINSLRTTRGLIFIAIVCSGFVLIPIFFNSDEDEDA